MPLCAAASRPQTQLTKSWLVDIGTPITTTYPTEAVRDRHTVPAGSMRAEELTMPASVTVWTVEWIVRPWFAVASLMPIHGMSPPQYSGCRRDGV